MRTLGGNQNWKGISPPRLGKTGGGGGVYKTLSVPLSQIRPRSELTRIIYGPRPYSHVRNKSPRLKSPPRIVNENRAVWNGSVPGDGHPMDSGKVDTMKGENNKLHQSDHDHEQSWRPGSQGCYNVYFTEQQLLTLGEVRLDEFYNIFSPAW